MKAENLRIGNYVFDRGNKIIRIDFMEHIQKGYDCKIGQLIFLEGNEVHPMTEYTDHAKPIPLTEEWLLKFGFDKYTEDYYELFNCVVHLKANRTFIAVGEYPNCVESELTTPKHVHQLQNLYFALTGKELKTE